MEKRKKEKNLEMYIRKCDKHEIKNKRLKKRNSKSRKVEKQCFEKDSDGTKLTKVSYFNINGIRIPVYRASIGG